MTTTDQRIADALERIADALEKQASHRDAAAWSPPAGDQWTMAAPKSNTARDALYRKFHAVRRTSAGWVTACAAGATGGTIDLAAARPIEKVPRSTREASRCDATGCRHVFALHPEDTQSS